MQIIEGLNVDFVNGEFVLKGDYAHKYGAIEGTLKVKLITLMELAASKTDNKIDDKIVQMVKAALA